MYAMEPKEVQMPSAEEIKELKDRIRDELAEETKK